MQQHITGQVQQHMLRLMEWLDTMLDDTEERLILYEISAFIQFQNYIGFKLKASQVGKLGDNIFL